MMNFFREYSFIFNPYFRDWIVISYKLSLNVREISGQVKIFNVRPVVI